MQIEKILIINKRRLVSKENKELFLIDFIAKNDKSTANFSQFTSKEIFDKISNILNTNNVIEIPLKYLSVDIVNNKLIARVDLKNYTDFQK